MEVKIIEVATGIHPSTGKFYELVLFKNPKNNESYLIRRYGPANKRAGSGTFMMERSAAINANNFAVQKAQKKSGGYEFQTGFADGSRLSKGGFGAGYNVAYSELLKHYEYCTIRGEDYTKVFVDDGTSVSTPRPPGLAAAKKEPPASTKLPEWGVW